MNLDDLVPDVDRSDPRIAGGAVLMYSGGADSSLAACLLAQVFPKVHLVTYTRLGFLQQDAPLTHFERMKLRFPEVEFHHHLIPYDKIYEEVERDRRFKFMLKYGTMTNVPCGHCKMAMHWRTLLFCKQHDVHFSADGAVFGNEWFGEQNPRILMQPLVDFYAEHDVTLLHPVFVEGLSTEAALFKLGITDSPTVKRTKSDKQIICSQHIMFAMFMRKELAKRPFEEFEDRSREYLVQKLDRIRELTEEHDKAPEKSKISKLLES